jgi:hypothetical protein
MAHAELDSDRADCEGSRVRGTYCYFNCPVGGLLLRVLSGSRWGRKAMSALPPINRHARPLPSDQRHDRAFDDVAVSAVVQQSVRQPEHANGDAGRANSSHVKPRFNRGTVRRCYERSLTRALQRRVSRGAGRRVGELPAE